MRRAPTVLGPLFLVSVMALGTGCQKIRERFMEKAAEKAAEKAIEAQTGQKVDLENNGEGFMVKGKDGKATVAVGPSVKLPDDFPKSVPVYPGAKLTAAMTNDANGKQAHVVMFQTPDKATVVGDYYKANLKGFKQTVDMNMGQTRMLALSDKANNVEVSLMISTEGDHTNVQLTALPSGATSKN
jgi:hypothetical protein